MGWGKVSRVERTKPTRHLLTMLGESPRSEVVTTTHERYTTYLCVRLSWWNTPTFDHNNLFYCSSWVDSNVSVPDEETFSLQILTLDLLLSKSTRVPGLTTSIVLSYTCPGLRLFSTLPRSLTFFEGGWKKNLVLFTYCSGSCEGRLPEIGTIRVTDPSRTRYTSVPTKEGKQV